MTELVRLGALIGPRLAAAALGGIVMADPSESGEAIFASGQWGVWCTNATGGNIAGLGMLDPVTAIDASSLRASPDDGIVFVQTTGAVIGNDARLISNTTLFTLNQEPLAVIKFRLGATTDIRLFVGLTNAGNPANADLMPQPSVGVQFSTDRADTNWQFLKKDATTQVLIDSGVAPDTSSHYVIVDAASATSVLVRVMDSAFVEQASTTFTTGLPTGTQVMSLVSAMETRANVDKTLNQYYATILLRNS